MNINNYIYLYISRYIYQYIYVFICMYIYVIRTLRISACLKIVIKLPLKGVCEASFQ